MEIFKKTDSVIISWDFSKGQDGKDHEVLLVGKRKPGQDVKIINAYQGKAAHDAYERLKKICEPEVK